MFKKLFSKIFKSIGSLSTANNQCVHIVFDEPEMPKSMIER